MTSSRQKTLFELDPDPLQLNDQGPAVVQLQLALTALEYYASEVNGNFDDATQQALITFQHHHQLSEEGFFGPETWYAMTFWVNEEQVPTGKQLTSKLLANGRQLISQALSILPGRGDASSAM